MNIQSNVVNFIKVGNTYILNTSYFHTNINYITATLSTLHMLTVNVNNKNVNTITSSNFEYSGTGIIYTLNKNKFLLTTIYNTNITHSNINQVYDNTTNLSSRLIIYNINNSTFTIENSMTVENASAFSSVYFKNAKELVVIYVYGNNYYYLPCTISLSSGEMAIATPVLFQTVSDRRRLIWLNNILLFNYIDNYNSYDQVLNFSGSNSTIQKSTNDILGIAAESGTAGDTIDIYVPNTLF